LDKNINDISPHLGKSDSPDVKKRNMSSDNKFPKQRVINKCNSISTTLGDYMSNKTLEKRSNMLRESVDKKLTSNTLKNNR